MMTIQLPNNLESPILEAVHSGRYASLDDAMAEAASLLVQRLKQEQDQAEQPQASQPEPAATPKPIWEEFAEIAASIPDEEWAKLPADGAEQHDHYIYGTPKRPQAQ
jgi:Arc/MetJ-type ribon-helix-helix transcriptional regulator